MRIASFLLAAGAALISSLTYAARPTIAVLPFSIDARVVITDGYSVITGTVEDQTSLLTNELVQQLVATRKFDVLERARVDDLIKEKQFQESDYAAPDEAAKIAKLLGADYFVQGRIDELTVSSQLRPIPYSSLAYTEQKAAIDLYLRVIDARTGKIVAAEKFSDEAKVKIKQNSDKRQPNAGKVLLVQAAQDMVNRIVNTVYPIKIAKVDGKTVYLNRGASSGYKVGDSLLIYSQGESMVDKDTGESLGNTEAEVAQAVVTGVEARFIKAELSQGNAADLKEGMLIKPVGGSAKAAAPAADLPAGPRW